MSHLITRDTRTYTEMTMLTLSDDTTATIRVRSGKLNNVMCLDSYSACKWEYHSSNNFLFRKLEGRIVLRNSSMLRKKEKLIFHEDILVFLHFSTTGRRGNYFDLLSIS